MSGESQAKAQYESIVELVARLADDIDEAVLAIHQDALAVRVRSDWQEPGRLLVPAEYEILLCTGGPAVCIRGELDDNKDPASAKMYHQDWFTPWTEYHRADEEVLLQYASVFYFGE